MVISEKTSAHSTKNLPPVWSKKAHSVSHFLRLVEAEKELEVKSGNDADFIFRGQREDKPLVPRIGRLISKGQELARTEKLMMDDFERQMLLFSEVELRDQWDLVAIAQHHRLPTRLLDWTYSALAALWFCVQKGPARKVNRDALDGVVWVFKTRVRDFISTDEPGSPFAQTRTRIFRPRFVSRRIMAQAGLFTCHKLHTGDNFVPLEKNKNYRARLMKIRIPPYRFSEIREQLGAAGVSSLSLFSDLDGLAEFLEGRYFHDPYELQRPQPVKAGRIKWIDPAKPSL